MPIIPFQGRTPVVTKTAWIAPDAWVIGDSAVGEHVSIFFGAVLRGDINPIRVGNSTNIQEGALLHTSTGLTPCIVGEHVTIGHRAIIHGCSIGNRCIIGMGATILDGAVVEDCCLIGANSLVTMNTRIPAGSLALGSPAKVVRPLTAAELTQLQESAAHYQRLGAEYQKSLPTKCS
ncbi:MAG: gamma carbonic anhydrase family protein [Proteobacteria bacterium]|nr:gamma carbonic anhydrase family protein [Pseudomonadota bacterium]